MADDMQCHQNAQDLEGCCDDFRVAHQPQKNKGKPDKLNQNQKDGHGKPVGKQLQKFESFREQHPLPRSHIADTAVETFPPRGRLLSLCIRSLF